MKKYNVIVAEDELPIRQYICDLLKNKNEYQIVGEAKNGSELKKLLKDDTAHIALLDIDLPEKNTLEVLSEFEKLPLIIFITAYNEYAVQAFEIGVVDYIVKPIEEIRFDMALNRAVNLLKIEKEKRENLMEHLWLKQNDQILPIPLSKIDYLQSDNKYTKLFSEKEEYKICKPLSRIYNMLNKEDFIQIHRRYIIRRSIIKKIEPLFKGNYEIVLSKNTRLPCSKNYFKKIKETINFI
ncbi:MAG: response regulator transcription factor [Spirochaetia bacterium]|nr:response regulator transcription factor [Spirochaetia bacterium]